MAGIVVDLSASDSDEVMSTLTDSTGAYHFGGLTPDAIEHQSAETVRQVAKIIKGEVPVGAVNADRWTRRP